MDGRFSGGTVAPGAMLVHAPASNSVAIPAISNLLTETMNLSLLLTLPSFGCALPSLREHRRERPIVGRAGRAPYSLS